MILALAHLACSWVTVTALIGGEAGTGKTNGDAQAEVRGIIAQAIGLGFPDIVAARLYQGRLSVRWADASGLRQSDFEGVHARLTDGAWLIACSLPLAPDARITIDVTGLEEVERAQLAQNDTQWLAENDDFERDRFDELESYYIAKGVTAITALHAGALHADDGLKNTAWELTGLALPWDARPLAIFAPLDDPRFWYGTLPTTTPTPPRTAILPPAALRKVLALWFRRQLLNMPEPFRALPVERAAQAALAIGGWNDAGFAQHLQLLLARARLRKLPPATDSDLPTRLRAWRIGDALQEDEGRPELQAMVARPADAQLPDDARTNAWRKRQSRRLAEWESSRFTAADLPALVALCSSTAPSLWLEAGQPRSLGDQALRAIASILEIEPRLLAGRDSSALWTDQERAAVAEGVSTWWAANRDRSLAEIRLALLPRLSLTAITHLLCMLPAAERPALITALVARWRAGPPEGPLELLLPYAEAHPDLATLIASWPADGPNQSLFAAWRLHRGERGPALALLDHALAMPGDDPGAATALVEAIAVNALKPDAALMQRLHGLLASDPLPALAQRVIASPPRYAVSPLDVLWDRLNGGTSGGVKMSNGIGLVSVALLAQLLMDRRPAPARLAAMSAEAVAAWTGQANTTLPADLRVCDVAALRARGILGAHVSDAEHEEFYGSFRLGPQSTVAERDRAIAFITEHVRNLLPLLLTQVQLPLAIPGFDLAKPRAAGAAGAGDF